MNLIPIRLILLVLGIKNGDEDINWDEVLQTLQCGSNCLQWRGFDNFFHFQIFFVME